MIQAKQMCARLMSLGIPKHVSSDIIDLIEKWRDKSGNEWTVNRLKEYKQLFIAKLANTTVNHTWIARNKDGYPKGPFSYIFRRLQNKGIDKALSALQSYTYFVSNEPTKAQTEKFMSALLSKESRGIESRFKHFHPLIKERRAPEAPPTIFEYCVSHTRMPGLTKSIPEMGNYVEAAIRAGSVECIRSCMVSNPEVFENVVPLDTVLDVEPYRMSGHPYATQSFGYLSGIQEPGYKLRVVANPDRVVQAGLEPLKNELRRSLEKIPEDCTFNQEKALAPIQKWLNSGRTVYSVDLSDATTLFPWKVTEDLLRKRFPSYQSHIDVMDSASRGPWTLKFGKRRNKDCTVQFTRGQPLGLGPSFFAFSLTHHNLLYGICKKLGKSTKTNDIYRILGDDVVISDHKVAKNYMRTLRNLGCKISENKTLISSYAAEFAGYVVTRQNIGKGMKWRELSNHSFLETVKRLGKRSLPLLTSNQRALVKFIGPVPRSFGGLGWGSGRKLDDFFSSNIGKASIDAYIDIVDKKLARAFPCESLDYHARRLSSGVRGYKHCSENLFHREFREKDPSDNDWMAWKQAINLEYQDFLPRETREKLDPDVPLRVISKETPPGFFRLYRQTGDPRPSVTTSAFIIYKAHLVDGGVRNPAMERFFQKTFNSSFDALDLVVNNTFETYRSYHQIRKRSVPKPNVKTISSKVKSPKKRVLNRNRGPRL